MKKNKKHTRVTPATPAAARRYLEEGNADFAQLLSEAAHTSTPVISLLSVDAATFGTGTPPVQRPFAALVGCSDARVPVEIIFQKACNDLFVVRVAGNVLTSEGLGSLDFAARQFASSLRLAVILGHTGCGAVTAAVDAFLRPLDYMSLAPSQPLRSILDRLFIAVRAADRHLRADYGSGIGDHPNYRAALIEVSVIMNSAMAANTLHQELRCGESRQLQVAFGVYDLETHKVSAPVIGKSGSNSQTSCLVAPPQTPEAFRALGRLAVRLPRIRVLLTDSSE